MVERDFSTFRLPIDNVYQLAPHPETGEGVIPEMARVFDVELGDTPNAENIGRLVGAIGKSRVLQESISQVQEVLGTDEDALGVAADWAKRSGVQEPLNRNLVDPEAEVPDEMDATVVTGAVANWQDRVVGLFMGRSSTHIYSETGNRTMNSPTEVINPNIVEWVEAESGLVIPTDLPPEDLKKWAQEHADVFPTESQYAEDVTAPLYRANGHEVTLDAYDTKSGDEIAAQFAERHAGLLGKDNKLVFARTANAGVQQAVQFLNAARKHNPSFGAEQAFVLTDTFQLARTAEQAANAREYQNPMTAIRQVAITGKAILEAASG